MEMPILVASPWSEDPRDEFFESKIRPVLAEHCYSCHNSLGQTDGGLVLDWRGGLLAGGDNGPVVLPGSPETSKLIAVIKHEIEGMEMPQGGAKLASGVIDDFERWIRDGMVDPRNSPPTKEQFASETSWASNFQRRLAWWSLQKVAPKTPLPNLQSTSDLTAGFHDEKASASRFVDIFIDRDLKIAGLSRQKRASPEALVRRLYHNMIGLPPSASELALGIQKIEESGVIDSIVDELLARPQFGEKWARHWMDWVRYADSHGSEGDPTIDNSWHYRDYLIRALNEDVPYDQLLREHLAGDLIDQPRMNQELGINESTIALSHWRMVFHGFFPTDALDEKVRFIDDQINVFSKAFLGLTVSCSRCHDHKFDPISQEDYYALFAVLNNCRPARAVIDSDAIIEKNAEKLHVLKQQIRIELCDRWLNDREQLLQDLISRSDFPEVPAPYKSVLSTWLKVREAYQRGDSASVISASSSSSNVNSQIKRWSFRNNADGKGWVASGFGLPTASERQPEVSKAGEFRIATEGNSIIQELLPSGIYSGLLSNKHAARLCSTDLKIEPSQQIWALVRGGGEATLRGVVQDYPRMGGIYPFVKPSGSWKWERMDMAYWEGDSAHLEFAHALDTAMPISNQQRSWFGIRDIVLTTSDMPPQSDLELSSILQYALQSEKEPNLETIAKKFVDQIENAIQNWRDDSLTDAQAVMLEELIRAGLLKNQLDQFSSIEGNPLKKLIDEFRYLESEIKVPTRVPSIEETQGRTQHLYVRGDHKSPAHAIEPNFLSALQRDTYSRPFNRQDLANELLRADNPLTHRIIVNRVWHHLFGRGLVPTPDNFGKLGDTPTHPELLDSLVLAFHEHNTSIKSLIKLLVMSEVWQSDSQPSMESTRVDPDNRLWSHSMVRRLDAEGIRDSLLSISGELDLSRYGPTVLGDSSRRGIYVRVQRNDLDPFLRAFDFPEPFATTGRRDSTNVPAQSLALMNDPQVSKLAYAWAQTMLEGPNATLSMRQRIEKMFVSALSSYPSEGEIDLIQDYFEESLRAINADQDEARKVLAAKKAADERIGQLISIAKTRFATKRGDPLPPPQTVQPIVRFDFEQEHSDSSGKVKLELLNGARVAGGALIVDGKGYATTSALPGSVIPNGLPSKTLEAWVQLNGYEQRGGGVVSIQSSDGSRFDAIVFGEQSPRRWMAGSEFYSRTKPFNGPEEMDAETRIVHIAVAHQEDGTVQGFRDGKPYGSPYQAGNVQRYLPNETILSFGVRHLPPSNGKMFVGKLYEARLYDRALTDEEIESSFRSFQYGFQPSLLPDLLDETELAEWRKLQNQMAGLNRECDSQMVTSDIPPELQALSDVGKAFFMMKEFLFIR